MDTIFLHRNIQNCSPINFEGLIINLEEPVFCFGFFFFFSHTIFSSEINSSNSGDFKNSLGISKFTYMVKIVAL